ncbi:MAG TPA: hypothetical protein VFF73_19780 [Planctomycetota bacterium]|nr:hypothetical protein [Planctomycetota bacterium]
MRSILVVSLVSVALLLGAGARAQDDGDKPPEGPEVEMAKSMTALLKAELELSDEQADKVKAAIQDGIKDGFKQMMKHMADEEQPDEQTMQHEREQIRDSILGKIRTVLDDSQKKEFEVLIKEFDQRAGKFERGQREAGGDALVWLEGELPTKERFLMKAENCLLLNEDEKKVVLPKVDAVVSARIKLHETRREHRKSLAQAARAGAKEDEMRERLHSFREKEFTLQREIRKAEEELRELVTVDQEARLVAIGVLD